jgi:hypothetical protein
VALQGIACQAKIVECSWDDRAGVFAHDHHSGVTLWIQNNDMVIF